MLKADIEKIIDDVDLDEAELNMVFTKAGYKYNPIDSDEDKTDHSTNVNWWETFTVEKDNQFCTVSISGTAIANISYDRWTDSDCYQVTDINVSEVQEKTES